MVSSTCPWGASHIFRKWVPDFHTRNIVPRAYRFFGKKVFIIVWTHKVVSWSVGNTGDIASSVASPFQLEWLSLVLGFAGTVRAVGSGSSVTLSDNHPRHELCLSFGNGRGQTSSVSYGTCRNLPTPYFLKRLPSKVKGSGDQTGQSHLAGDDRYSNQFKVACNSQGELHQSIFLSEEGSLRAVLKDKSR